MTDKRLVGKWYKEELGETINIFDADPLRVKMSFSSSGFFNFEPNCVYEKDGDFCYEINDETYRMVYHLHYDNGELKGYYTRLGKQTPVLYKLVSSTPEDLPFEYKPTVITVPGTDKSRIEILKEFSKYSDLRTEKPVSFEYILNEPAPAILEKYNYSDYISKNDTDKNQIVFSILDFVCDHFGHDGCGGMGNSRKAEDIIKFCELHNMKTNCRGLAILFASLLRMNGVRAVHITCLPYEEPFDDCHVVVECFLPSGEEIMLDPTYRLYLRDSQNKFIALPHLRELLIDDEPYIMNDNASYNGNKVDINEHRTYMIKNTFRFSRGAVAKDGFDERSSRRLELIPDGYPADKFDDGKKSEFVYCESDFWG
jgi:Transglutaminase-like enzymes, putative cysteine proteases